MTYFKPSVNINYDIGNKNLYEGFVPNSNQVKIISDVLSSFTGLDDHAQLLVGPYGAGKSMVGALIASVLTEKKWTKPMKKFLYNISLVNPEQHESIVHSLSQRTGKILPVVITGKRGDFQEIILDALITKLREEGVNFQLLGESTQILNVVALWKKDFQTTFSKFEEYCLNHSTTANELLTKIKSGDEDSIQQFKLMYTFLTSGATFNPEIKTSFVEQLSYLMKQLQKKSINILIVYDEFGRFLQTIGRDQIHQTMQDLQDAAELANRQQNLSLLFITHTGLLQYSNSNNELTKGELERVEKRFKNHRLESDSSLFYRSAFNIIRSATKEVEPNLFLMEDTEQYRNDILKYDLFPDMSPSEIDGAILEGCQPIHPLSIRLLPPLSNILGQNDRTLYTFLSNKENYSSDQKWYYADALFDYFYPDESVFFMIDELRYYRIALNYNLPAEAIRVVKILTLLKIINNPFRINTSFLEFALGLKKLKSIIELLEEKKLIRYNRFSDSLELFSGSLQKIDDLFLQAKESTLINNDKRTTVLEKVFENKYYLPLKYNSKKSMIRFIESKFVLGLPPVTLNTNKDGSIVYALTDNPVQLEEKMKDLSYPDDVIFCVAKVNLIDLTSTIDSLYVYNKIAEQNEDVKYDSSLLNEIEIRIDNLLYDLQNHLKPIYNFDSSLLSWGIRNEKIEHIDSKETLEIYLSNWMFHRFPMTLEVRNEAFNKTVVSTVQKKAAMTILDKLLASSFDGSFNIDGQGPDYLIFASIFKNNKYKFDDLDNLTDKSLAYMREELKNFVSNNPRGKILDLFDLLQSEPFGVRPPLVPLLTVALLKDYWIKMAFYANDFYINDVSSELIYQIIEQNVEFYEYEIYQLDQEENDVVSDLNAVFFAEDSILHPFLMFEQLTKWLRNLPRYTQISDKQSNRAIVFKEAIRHSETDPLQALKTIASLISVEDNNSKDQLEKIKNELEKFITRVEIDTQSEIYDLIGFSSWESWSKENYEIQRKSDIIGAVVEKALHQQNWFAYLIDRTVGVPLKDWSDNTKQSFLLAVQQLLLTDDDSAAIKVVLNDQTVMQIKELELSVKGKTIYNNVNRIVQAGGRTISNDEAKYIIYKVLQNLT